VEHFLKTSVPNQFIVSNGRDSLSCLKIPNINFFVYLKMNDWQNDKKKPLAPSRRKSIKEKNLGRLNHFENDMITKIILLCNIILGYS